jgi:uncharacterized membrane protein YbaN (DUF454 family)
MGGDSCGLFEYTTLAFAWSVRRKLRKVLVWIANSPTYRLGTSYLEVRRSLLEEKKEDMMMMMMMMMMTMTMMMKMMMSRITMLQVCI